MRRFLLTILVLALFGVNLIAAETFVIAVTDPLAKQLACDCVKGFAQRDYLKLAEHLKKTTNLPEIEVVFAGSIAAAMEKSSEKRVDMIIGKDSVVRAELKKEKIPARLINRLTNKNGETTFTGLIVVAADDPAKSVADLKNHRIVFGPADCDEKYAAAIKLFEKNSVSVPEKKDVADNCTLAGLEIIENKTDKPVAAVVSDYALVLIEGCKTIEKGALRVLDKTEPVPFIAVFVPNTVPLERTETVYNALLAVESQPKLLEALETKNGFVRVEHKGRTPWEPIIVDEKKAETNSKN